jgi:hypothetical protein
MARRVVKRKAHRVGATKRKHQKRGRGVLRRNKKKVIAASTLAALAGLAGLSKSIAPSIARY